MGNNSHAIGIAVFCKILPGEQMGNREAGHRAGYPA